MNPLQGLDQLALTIVIHCTDGDSWYANFCGSLGRGVSGRADDTKVLEIHAHISTQDSNVVLLSSY